MRKHFFVFLAIALATIGLASCRSETGTATLKLILRKTDLGAKTMLPGDPASLQITRFRVSGTGPDNGTFEVSTDNTSVIINGLRVGTWTVQADGLNSSGVKLIQGSTTCELTHDSGTVEIVLNQTVGTGTFMLSVDWANTDVPDPHLELYIKPQDGAESVLEFQPNYASKMATAKKSLAAGSYIVRGVLKSGDFHVGGFVDSVRIVGGQTTTGSVVITQMQYSDTSGYFLLVNKAGEPVRGVLSGFDETDPAGPKLEAHADSKITFTLDNYFEQSPGLQIEWFLDGLSLGPAKTLGSTNSQTINVDPGSHRIDAVVNNSLVGSYDCASTAFIAYRIGPPGSLSKLSDITSILVGKSGGVSQYVQLGSDTMVSPLPTGKFLIVSPSRKTIAVAKVVRNYLDTVTVYNEKDFPYIDAIDLVKSDPSQPWVVFRDHAGTTDNLTFLKFDEKNCSLTLYGGTSRIEGGSFLAGHPEPKPAYYSQLHDINFSPLNGMCYVLVTGFQYGEKNKPTNRLIYFDNANGIVDLKGYKLIQENISDSTRYCFSPTGYSVARVIDGERQVGIGDLDENGGLYAELKKLGGMTSQPTDVIMMSDTCIITAQGNCLNSFTGYIFDDMESQAYLTPQVVNVNATRLAASAQRDYLYALDPYGRNVGSFSCDSIGNIEEIGTCHISSNSSQSLTGFALSGSYVLVATNVGLSLCKVMEKK